MIKFEHTDVHGFEAAIRGMRNPKNSWAKSDSVFPHDGTLGNVGPGDLTLMKVLVMAGDDHGKFARMITVTVDITAPLYWWKEFDTYKVGTVADSCSTMHKLHERDLTLADFSYEHLGPSDTVAFQAYLNILNINRSQFVRTKDTECWWRMIQMLPTSYNQRRTVQMNYQVLRRIYAARRNHKLDEWRDLCENWIPGLPCAGELIMVGM